MIKFKSFASPETLEEAYTLSTNKRNVILGGMLWLKMNGRNYNTAIDLSRLGLDKIEEKEDYYSIGAMVSLRTLETHEGLNQYTQGALKHSVEYLIGVQFRNCATIGGSIAGRFGFSDVFTLFLAMDAQVELYKAGIVPIAKLLEYPRPLGDLLVRVLLPKNIKGVVYTSQRNSATDFPALTCAVSKIDEEYRCVLGARPSIATLHLDPEGILKDGINEKSARDYGQYVADHTTFGSNMIAGKDYRKKISSVLVRRSLLELENHFVTEKER